MAADAVSFWIKPFGFFDRNPSLDVAPSDAVCHPVDGPEGEPMVHEHPKHEHAAHDHGSHAHASHDHAAHGHGAG